ncbi:MAG: ABC transporter ATP-binding protein [Candidatus Spechtbacterales bacterium]
MLLEATNISKTYGRKEAAVRALNNISLAIDRGESVAIVGKSGSGKSTLMHILAGLDRPSEGAVALDGRSLSNLPPTQLADVRNFAFGFVFQQFFLNGRDSVLENVELPLKIRGVEKSERTKAAMEALKQVELEDKADARAQDLSGGQKQRVAVARAIVTNPRVLFADEPTGNLDSKTGERIINLLFSLNKEHHIALVVVTHDEDLAKRCQRRLFLKDGSIVDSLDSL